MKTARIYVPGALVVVIAFGTMSLGGSCDHTASGGDGGASDAAPADAPSSDAVSDGAAAHDGAASDARATDAAGDGGQVGATCTEVCACLAAACADYPFAPDCVTACQDPTNNPPWDLSCRAGECAAARTNHDAHCPAASGQTTCH